MDILEEKKKLAQNGNSASLTRFLTRCVGQELGLIFKLRLMYFAKSATWIEIVSSMDYSTIKYFRGLISDFAAISLIAALLKIFLKLLI